MTAVVGIANTHKRRLVSYLVGSQVASVPPRRLGRTQMPGQFLSTPVQASPIFRQRGHSITYITPPRFSARKSPSSTVQGIYTNETPRSGSGVRGGLLPSTQEAITDDTLRSSIRSGSLSSAQETGDNANLYVSARSGPSSWAQKAFANEISLSSGPSSWAQEAYTDEIEQNTCLESEPIKKRVGFYESPTTGRPVSKYKHYTVGEPISYTEADSPTANRQTVLEPISYMEDVHPTMNQQPDLKPAAHIEDNKPATNPQLGYIPTRHMSDDNPTAREQAALDAQLFGYDGYAQESSPESENSGRLPLPTFRHSDLLAQSGGQSRMTSTSKGATNVLSTLAASQCESSPRSNEGSGGLFVQPGDQPTENHLVSGSMVPTSTHAADQCESSSESQTGSDCLFVQPGAKPEVHPENIALPRTPSPRTPSPTSLGLDELELSDRRKKARGRKEAERKAREQALIDKKKAERQAHLDREADAKLIREGVRRIPKEDFIQPLSNDWDQRLAEALQSPMDAVIGHTSKNVAITRKDIGTVLPQRNSADNSSGWVNDEIIAAGVQMVVDYGLDRHASRPTRSYIPRIHAFNSFFYNNLKTKGYKSIEKWATKAKIGGKDLLKVEWVFIPINVNGTHWTLAAVSPTRKTIEYFDSLHGSATPVVSNIRKWLRGELRDAYKESEWKVLEDPAFGGRGKGPTQDNAKDCGIFSVTTAKAIVLGVDPMAVSAADMPLQRRRVVAEIMNGGFKGDFQPNFTF